VAKLAIDEGLTGTLILKWCEGIVNWIHLAQVGSHIRPLVLAVYKIPIHASFNVLS
jgi:hypothetical protein